MTEERFEFATPEWFVMFRSVVAGLDHTHDGPDESVSVSEVYRDVPVSIAGHENPVGWTIAFDAGRVSYQPIPDLSADVALEVDYDVARAMLQEFDPNDELARRQRKAEVAAANDAGKFQVRGDLRRSPRMLRELHDALAARTVQGDVRHS